MDQNARLLDIDLNYRDVQDITSGDVAAAFFDRLGYNTGFRNLALQLSDGGDQTTSKQRFGRVCRSEWVSQLETF